MFPQEDMLGIDLVLPDISYLLDRSKDVLGIFLSHGHEDHIGGLPYALKKLNVPVYGTRLTLGLVKPKLKEHRILRESDLRENQARVREAEASREGAELRARDEVERARLDLDSAVANRQKAKEQLALARENQNLVNVNYKAGAATYLEVSDANLALLTAELSQVSESLNADLAKLRLLKAAGQYDPR